MINQVCIIGLGYIGLPTAAVTANSGIRTLGVDIKTEIVEKINSGKVHIVEPGLADIVSNEVKTGRLRAGERPETSDVFLIAVPTPFIEDEFGEKIPDLHYIKESCKSIAKVLKKNDLVILESTSPVGTTEQMSKWMAEIRTDLVFPTLHGDPADIYIAYCPERVLPGRILDEIVNNDRIVGGLTLECTVKATKFYGNFVRGECIGTNSNTAELCKLVENSFRDVNIAFANEISMICDKLNLNTNEVIEYANRHPRVNILNPGAGVGGHCIAVDPWFIISAFPSEANMMKQARVTNDRKATWVVEKVIEMVENYKYIEKKNEDTDIKVCCFGLSYKPDIDDLRESPALDIAKRLNEIRSIKLLAVEPNYVGSKCEGVEIVDIEEGLSCDVLVMLVPHKEFLSINPHTTYIVDTAGCWISRR